MSTRAAPHYADDTRVREARAAYFEANGFGDGGYRDAWVTFKVGPFPVAFPNTAGRVRAVRLHDLHHVATDYDTDLVGEAEIGAWELASGCRDFWAAWVLNGLAMLGGVWLAPRRVWRAWQRGRRSRNLYEGEWDEALLELRVGELRRRLEVPVPEEAA